MHAIGTDGCGERRVVVEDEGHSSGAAQWQDALGDSLDVSEVMVFRAELEPIGPTGQQGCCDLFGVGLRDIPEVEDAVEIWDTGHGLYLAFFDEPGNPADVIGAGGKIRVGNNFLLEGDGGFDATDHKFTKGAFHASHGNFTG